MMKNWKETLISFVFITIISLFFFYPILKGQIPFPGDLLVGNYAPYTSYSYAGYAPGGVPNKAQGPDVIKEIYPWKLFSIDQLKKGQIPFWNPYNFSGNPLMANFQSNVFYPLNLLFFLLPFMHAWTLYIFLTPVLAGWFVSLYLRHKDIDIVPSLFGGIVFAFSSYMVVWMEYGNIGHTLLWLPLGLLLIDLFFETKNLRYPFFLVLILFLSFLAGYIQGFFYLTGILFLYSCFFLRKNEKFLTFFLLPIFIAPLLIGAFQLFPTLSLFSNSSRGGYSLAQIQYLLNPLWYMITLLVPDFFGNPAARNFWFNGTYIERVSSIGIIPLFFAFSTIFQKHKTKEILFFSFLAGVSLLLTTDLFVTKYFYLIPIPVISTTVPTRMLSIFVFCASILSGFGLDYFVKRKNNIPFIISGTIIVSTLMFAGGFLGIEKVSLHSLPAEQIMVSLKNLLISSGILIGEIGLSVLYIHVGKKPSYVKGIFIGLLFILVFLDLFRFFQRITPFSQREFAYPITPVISYLKKSGGIDRTWGYDQGLIESNFQTADKIYSPEGNDPLHNKQYTEFIMSSKNGKIPAVPARPDANILNGNSDADFLHNIYRQKVLNILGVKYVLNKDTSLTQNLRTNNQRFDPQIYSLIWQDAPWQIYQNNQVVSRAFFTSTYVVATSQKALDTLFSPKFDMRREIVLEKNGPYTSQDGEGQVHILSYTPNEVTLKVRSTNNGYVFLSDVYTSNWHAKVDGKSVPVLRADYAFRAVPVARGTHTVIFSYQDNAFMKGLVVSGISVIVLVGYFLFFRYYKKWNYESN
jgi:hypothetical protein